MDLQDSRLEEVLTEICQTTAWREFWDYIVELRLRLSEEIFDAKTMEEVCRLQGVKSCLDAIMSFRDNVVDAAEQAADISRMKENDNGR